MFTDRLEAGRRLTAALRDLDLDDPVIYALPRGGVPVAAEIATALGAPLDLVLVRKIGMPGNEELALGAVVDGAPPTVVTNDDIVRRAGLTEADVDRLADVQCRENDRRRSLYLGGREPLSPRGRTAVVVDDGLATGATARAAVAALRRQGAARIVLAVPVAPVDALDDFAALVDDIVCLERATWFRGVGAFYRSFPQLDDGDVLAILTAHRAGAMPAGPPAPS
jgi:predicted phosphoribosyltransferase